MVRLMVQIGPESSALPRALNGTVSLQHVLQEGDVLRLRRQRTHLHFNSLQLVLVVGQLYFEKTTETDVGTRLM